MERHNALETIGRVRVLGLLATIALHLGINLRTATAQTNVSGTPLASEEPQIAVSDHQVFVAWLDHSSGVGDVLFAVSQDDGKSFGRPVNLSFDAGVMAGNASAPRIAASAGNVFVAWRESVPFAQNDIFLAVSTDAGTTFDNFFNLTGSQDVSKRLPEIVVSGNFAHVVWGLTASNASSVYYRRIAVVDGVATPGLLEVFNAGGVRASRPQVAASGDWVYVVWQTCCFGGVPDNSEIFLARSFERGRTFPLRENLSDNTGRSAAPRLAASGDNVYVIWTDDAGFLLAASRDDGFNFEMPYPDLATEIDLRAAEPEIVAAEDVLYVAWAAPDGGVEREVFLAPIGNGNQGTTFGTTLNLSGTPNAESGQVHLAARANNVHVVWAEDEEIVFRPSRDQAISFGPVVSLSNGNARDPRTAIVLWSVRERLGWRFKESTYTVWADDTPGQLDIFFYLITDYRWKPPVIVAAVLSLMGLGMWIRQRRKPRQAGRSISAQIEEGKKRPPQS